MNFKRIAFTLALAVLCFSQNLSPFDVLELDQTASQAQVRARYKDLKKASKNNKAQQKLYDDAYQQIMIDFTLQMTLSDAQKKSDQPRQRNRRRRRRRGMPRLSDMFRQDYYGQKSAKSSTQKAIQAEDKKNYAEQNKVQQTEPEYEYRLPPEFDDPSFYKDQKKAQQTLKEQKVAWNKKAAGYILFFAGMLLKLTPCICLFMIWKCSRRGQRDINENDNPFVKAMNGWTGKNRRQPQKKKY